MKKKREEIRTAGSFCRPEKPSMYSLQFSIDHE